MKTLETFYLVWCPTRFQDCSKHSTYEDAKNAAARVAEDSGEIAFVMESQGCCFKRKEPVVFIEAGQDVEDGDESIINPPAILGYQQALAEKLSELQKLSRPVPLRGAAGTSAAQAAFGSLLGCYGSTQNSMLNNTP